MSNEKKEYVLNTYKDQPRPKLYNDFYGWVNYNWLITNTIPEDETKYTHFIETQFNINDKLKKILESGQSELATILYNSYLDKLYKNTKCLSELKKLIKIVDKIHTKDDLITMATRLLFINVCTLFNIQIDANVYSSMNNITYITQPSLGLPNRVYYTSLKYSKIKQKYYDTICLIYKELFPSFANDELNRIASLIIDIETNLSIIFLDSADKRDTDKILNQITLTNAIKQYPTLKINLIVQILILLSNNTISEDKFSNIIIEHHSNPSINYFKQLETLLDSYSIDQWKEYYRYKIILTYMNLTNQQMKNYHFDMFKKTLKGQSKPKLLWRSAVSFTCSIFNDLISQIYTKKYFSNTMNDYMDEMVINIKKATKDRILKLDWMTDATKRQALVKLEKMKLKLGYGKSRERNYDDIILTPSLIKNTLIMNRHNFIHELNKLNSTIDPDDWDLPAYLVNAYFNPTRNEIIFPTSILQPPFLDLTKSDIYNYANIGSIIGHEIIHGFDDQGSKFDENGSLKNWWSFEDRLNFNEKVSQIINIYDNEGVNGKLTAGENIADFGAVSLPIRGLKYKLNRELTLKDKRDFYMEYARHWQYLIKEEAAIERKLSDPHSFSDLRVNIPLKHQPWFQEIFNIQPENSMYISPKDILTIW
jgi:putative endopeptidase